MQRTRSIVLGVGLVGLLAISGTPRSALGQNALGDGRALDRNLQRGSGGVNTKVRDLDAQIKMNNAIVTGNAAYGRSFRGDVGYLATDDFRAGLGSNDLFKEQRISAGSDALGGVGNTGGSGIFARSDPSASGSVRFSQQGIRGTDALRYQMSMTTGTSNPEDNTGGLSSTVRRAGTGASGRTVGNAIRSTSEFRAQRSVQPTILGTVTGPEGQSYALLASPLMGVKLREVDSGDTPATPDQPGKWRPTGVESQARMARESLASDVPAGAPPKPRPNAVTTKVDTAEIGSLPVVLERFGAESKARQDVNGRVDTTARPSDVKPGDRANLTPPANPNAPNPNDTVPGVRPGEKPDAPPTPGDNAPGANPASTQPEWLSSLEDMRRSLRGEPPLREKKKPEAKPGDEKPADANPLIPTTPEERRLQLDARVKAILDAQGFHEKDAFNVDQVEAARKARVKVNTMIAGRPASVYYVDRMVDGEAALREERYFDAEDAFSRALSASPRDALAQAGRVHAQVGAGLYMSGAANLRELYATHPEMIGVKFDASVMPAADRMKLIREQLTKAAARTDTALSGDAGLLLGYLAYQAGDLEGVHKGLAAFGAKIEPGNTADLALLELAAKVWKSPVPADLPVLDKAPAPLPVEAPKPAGSGDVPNK